MTLFLFLFFVAVAVERIHCRVEERVKKWKSVLEGRDQG